MIYVTSTRSYTDCWMAPHRHRWEQTNVCCAIEIGFARFICWAAQCRHRKTCCKHTEIERRRNNYYQFDVLMENITKKAAMVIRRRTLAHYYLSSPPSLKNLCSNSFGTFTFRLDNLSIGNVRRQIVFFLLIIRSASAIRIRFASHDWW